MMEEDNEIEEHHATEKLAEDTSSKMLQGAVSKKSSKGKDGKNDNKSQNIIWHAS
ncbi:MAG: hypothetical protein WCI04_04520 [archaeon]